jgi:hypothetical protein
MDAKQLIEQLTRETKANPAKATLLAVMCGVLLYVCLPLIVGSGSKESKPVVQADEASTKSHKTQTTPSDPKPVANDHIAQDWSSIAQAIDVDNRMKSAKNKIGRDPFAPPPEPKVAVIEEEADPIKQETPKPRKIHFTPSEVGLVLGSTLRGTHRRVAMINGKPYHAYDPKQTDNRRSVIPFMNSQQETSTPEGPAYFVLIDVRPRSIVLWRQGQRYEMNLPGVVLAGRSSSGTNLNRPNPIVPPSALAP